MGLQYRIYLDGNRVFGCRDCRTHLSTDDHIMSRGTMEMVAIPEVHDCWEYDGEFLPRPSVGISREDRACLPLQKRRERHRGPAGKPRDADRTAHRRRHPLLPLREGGWVEISDITDNSLFFSSSASLSRPKIKAFRDAEKYKEGKFILEKLLFQEVV
ncbi:hypothetical protein BC936DRAFT_140447 [Jimgerdemannia flammicorona]|uniref:Yippee domain-containing protein n=1 Tax=Jimgerdemannia flammicorona TaxID=994334 RepID=A0A433ATW4_9FUNG|nr:hypothetical protein BC936DRAFT_140447 [Jimgerdemannia flammicorona]